MEMFTGGLAAILVLLGQGFILQKMGEKFWKGLIPIYGAYLLFKKVWDTKNFWILITSSIILAACMSGIGYFWSVGVTGGIVLPLMVLMIAFGIGLTIQSITFMYKLAKAFGHGAGYTVGLVVLEPIFVLLLGLNNDKYQVVA